MDIEVTKRNEHICLKSDLDLKVFGEKFVELLSLPSMEYDFENETEWLTIDFEKFGYNISKPYEDGTLQEWDDTVPEGCNFGIVLSIRKDHPSAHDELWINKMITEICEQLAEAFNTNVYYHRTCIFA